MAKRKKGRGASRPLPLTFEGQRKKEGVLSLEDLVEMVQLLIEVDKETAKKAVYTIFWSLIRELRELRPVAIRRFGRFYPYRLRATRRGAGKGRVVDVPAYWTVKFAPHKMVDYLLNPHQFYPKEHFDHACESA